jgi:glycosyltransferase involved in cell wall biosynthesis
MAFGKTAGPCVSVLIDTYNYGHFIEEAVESVLAQDFPEREREIVVVDDGSTDDTPERLKKFGHAITYLRKPNGGQASAFNLGFGFAREICCAAGRGRLLAAGETDAHRRGVREAS